VRLRFPLLFLLLLIALLTTAAIAQSPGGTISGLVLDPSGRAIVGADILIMNDGTRIKYPGTTNSEGLYAVQNLPPGPYRIQISKIGFKSIIKPDIVLNVQAAVAINFTLPVGAISQTVTVEGGAPLVNTESAAVSTVVDRKFLETMPLNGRSFQDLVLLTPGVVTNSPQSAAFLGVNGEFSVNGQRTESNYYVVDGVSGNAGASAGQTFVASLAGSLPSSTALGTTQSLVSVDALQEFRVQTSTYSAEYGRTPGGQFSFATRSGTNQWHGTAFDYLRNDVFDANDWFNSFLGLEKSALRQNDFGGTIGGPMEIPRIYHGKDKTFFFFSYEGLRLLQPQPATVQYVPDATLRTSAPASLQPVLNAFPQANCGSSTPNCTSPGDGLAGFVSTWSNPSRIDAENLRLDHFFGDHLKLFFRFSDTSSQTSSRPVGSFQSPAELFTSDYTTRTYTVGATSLFAGHVSNEWRLNYASSEAIRQWQIDGFGGGTAVNLAQLQGVDTKLHPAYSVSVTLAFSGFSPSIGQYYQSGIQSQWNLVDTVGMTIGKHELKIGADYRRSAPIAKPFTPNILYNYFSEDAVLSNGAFVISLASAPAYPLYTNFSAFVQDEWRVSSRLTLSTGIRWEVNPAPSSTKGKSNLPYTVEGDSLSTLVLAPQGTRLWDTSWYNLAPRLGAVYLLRNPGGFETAIRGGAGLYFDTGQQNGSGGYSGVGFSALSLAPAGSFSLPFAQVNPTIVNPPTPPYTDSPVYAFPRHLQLPYTLQWNASIEQAMGRAQALTASYVGAHGQRLLQAKELNLTAINPNFGTVLFYSSGLASDYDALQLQFQRRIGRGLHALASYTWSHSIDFGSFNSSLPYQRGNSDFDVRHNFAAAFSYDLLGTSKNTFLRIVLSDWGIDGRLTARTGFPVTLSGGSPIVDPGTGQYFYAGLDLVPGVPLYLHGSQYPGGFRINPAAFSTPSADKQGNAPRNFVYGFGTSQLDLAIRRQFSIYERLKLQFRAEAFNLLNHPNFGAVNSTYCATGPGCTFGEATSTLAQSLGILSPLYQMGGPRSTQFSLRLIF
jgi:hypothetical protein